MAETVVGRALLRVLETLIRFADRFELALGIGTSAVLVGMEFHRQATIGALDRRCIGGARDTERFVIIGLAGHS